MSHTEDELIDHIRRLEQQLAAVKSDLKNANYSIEDFENNYVHSDDVADAAYDHGMISREDVNDYVDETYWVDRDEHNEIVRSFEQLAEAVDNFDDCDCSVCKEVLMEALGDARSYV